MMPAPTPAPTMRKVARIGVRAPIDGPRGSAIRVSPPRRAAAGRRAAPWGRPCRTSRRRRHCGRSTWSQCGSSRSCGSRSSKPSMRKSCPWARARCRLAARSADSTSGSSSATQRRQPKAVRMGCPAGAAVGPPAVGPGRRTRVAAGGGAERSRPRCPACRPTGPRHRGRRRSRHRAAPRRGHRGAGHGTSARRAGRGPRRPGTAGGQARPAAGRPRLLPASSRSARSTGRRGRPAKRRCTMKASETRRARRRTCGLPGRRGPTSVPSATGLSAAMTPR